MAGEEQELLKLRNDLITKQKNIIKNMNYEVTHYCGSVVLCQNKYSDEDKRKMLKDIATIKDLIKNIA